MYKNRVIFNNVGDDFLEKLLSWLQNEVPLEMMPEPPKIQIVKLEAE